MTAGEEEKSAFPISSPLFPPPPRFFSLLEALGCESHFLSSRQNGPRVSGGGGVRVGKEAAAGTGFLFHPGSLLPAASAGGRGEESGVGPRRGALGDGCPPARPGAVLGACLPAGLPLPRHLAACLGSTAGERRPGQDESSRRAEDPPPSQASSPAGPVRPAGPKRRQTRVALILADSARAQCRSRPPSRPECGILRWGGGERLEGAKMALGLARRQGWWRSCSAGAIFPGGAGGALRAPRGPGRREIEAGGEPRSVREAARGAGGRTAELRACVALSFPRPPDPEDRRLGGDGGWGPRHLAPYHSSVKKGVGWGSGLAADGFPP